MTNPDPLEGFQITDYDPKTQKVTIEIHPSLLQHPKSQQAMFEKCRQIMEGGPSVSSVEVKPRNIGG